MKLLIALCLCLMLTSCGEKPPQWLIIDATVVMVFEEEEGMFTATKVWRTTLRGVDGVVFTRYGKLGKEGDEIKIKIANPEFK